MEMIQRIRFPGFRWNSRPVEKIQWQDMFGKILRDISGINVPFLSGGSGSGDPFVILDVDSNKLPTWKEVIEDWSTA